MDATRSQYCYFIKAKRLEELEACEADLVYQIFHIPNTKYLIFMEQEGSRQQKDSSTLISAGRSSDKLGLKVKLVGVAEARIQYE